VVVGKAEARGMSPPPEFEVLGSVVIMNPVLVMHLFPRLKQMAKHFCHDEAMFQDDPTPTVCHFSIGAVWRQCNQHIAFGIVVTTPFP
jgi:hypothetical protein